MSFQQFRFPIGLHFKPSWKIQPTLLILRFLPLSLMRSSFLPQRYYLPFLVLVAWTLWEPSVCGFHRTQDSPRLLPARHGPPWTPKNHSDIGYPSIPDMRCVPSGTFTTRSPPAAPVGTILETFIHKATPTSTPHPVLHCCILQLWKDCITQASWLSGSGWCLPLGGTGGRSEAGLRRKQMSI